MLNPCSVRVLFCKTTIYCFQFIYIILYSHKKNKCKIIFFGAKISPSKIGRKISLNTLGSSNVHGLQTGIPLLAHLSTISTPGSTLNHIPNNNNKFNKQKPKIFIVTKNVTKSSSPNYSSSLKTSNLPSTATISSESVDISASTAHQSSVLFRIAHHR